MAVELEKNLELPENDDLAVLKQSKLWARDSKVESFLRMMAFGSTPAAACEKLGIHYTQPYNWRKQEPTFARTMDRARRVGEQHLEQRLLDIPFEEDPAVARLFSENAKWVLGRRNPSVYGDKVEVNTTATISIRDAMKEGMERASRPRRDPVTIEDGEIIEESRSWGNSVTDSKSEKPSKSKAESIFD